MALQGTSGDDTRVVTRTPAQALRPFVRRLLVVEATGAHRDVHLPDTGVVAAFRFRGDCLLYGERASAPRAAVTGLWDTARAHEHSADHAAVIVSFTAAGAAAWLRRPADELANATVDLGALVGRAAAWDGIVEQLAAAPDHARRLRLVEDLLLARAGDAPGDPLVGAAVGFIERTQGIVRI